MRISPVHYIAPSAISIIPNANNSHRDLAVYVDKGTKIKVRCPRAGVGMDANTSTYQEWALDGRNRRLADITGTVPYTIYARLSKSDHNTGYIVFAKKTQHGNDWTDAYSSLTLDANSTDGYSVRYIDNGIEVKTKDPNYYFIRLGDVSVAENGQRTVTLDTGILGTDDYNNNWAQNPDDLPLRIELGCTIDNKDVGQNPYVYWNQSLVLKATLVEGWTGMDIQRFDHWEIMRNTDDNPAESNWLDNSRKTAFSTSGEITLTHGRSNDDFNGAVATTFTIMAIGLPENSDSSDSSSSEDTELVVLKTATITILAETIEYSKEREWIYLRSQTAITFGTQEHPNPADIAYGQVNPAQAAGHVTNDSNQDKWVPEGWWNEMQGTEESTPYEYGSYRDYTYDSDSSSSDSSSSDDGGHWGPYSTPKIWSHYGKDGENPVRIDLDNEYEDFIYDDAGNRKSGIVTSQARLYEGLQQKTTGVTWALSCYDDDNHWVSQGDTYTDTNAKAKISNSGLLTIEEIYIQSAKVRVRATYKNRYYYTAFTANRQSQDKYELTLTPNAIPYNPSTYTGQSIAISVTRQDITGERVALSFGSYNDKTKISATSGKGYLRLFAPVKTEVAQGTFAYIPTQVTSASFSVSGTHAAEQNNILFRLKKYENCETSDTYGESGVLADYETVPINKAENGTPGTIYQRIYRSLNVYPYPDSAPSGDSPSGWSTSPTAILSTARYRYVSERSSNDGGATWPGGWSSPVVDAYLSEDGTSISIKGEAAAVIPWGSSLPASSTDGNLYLMNNDDANSIYQYDNGQWDAVTAATGDSYLVDGHLWRKERETASASAPRWRDLGQIKGDKGDDAEYYALSSPDIVTFRRNYAGVASAVTTSLVLTLTHSVGSTQERLYDIPSGMTLKTSTNGTTWATASSQSLVRNVAADFISGSNVYSRVHYGLFKGSTLIDSDYADVQYEVQRMLVPAGTYEDKQYTRTVNTTPLVYVDSGTYDGTYWFLVADNNGSDSPYTTPGSDDNVWQQASEFDVVLTKMLFARFANLGSFIVYDRYFFSQYGDIINSSGAVVQSINAYTPNYNGQVGYSYFDPADPMATTHGTHSLGKSVWFRPTKCINALTGEEWGASGNVKFNADGSGYLAGGRLTWDNSGNVQMAGTDDSLSLTTENDDMYTVVQSGGVEIHSKTTQSYGIFRLNDDGEIILSMFDKNGNRVINLGGTPSMMTNGEWVTWKLKKVNQGGNKDYYTTTESDCTTYYQLFLGQMTNSSTSIQYFLPPADNATLGVETTDNDVKSRNGMVFTSKGSGNSGAELETSIKGLTAIPDGYYVKPNDGRFGVDANQYGPTNYWVTLYHFSNGKPDGTFKQQFGF